MIKSVFNSLFYVQNLEMAWQKLKLGQGGSGKPNYFLTALQLAMQHKIPPRALNRTKFPFSCLSGQMGPGLRGDARCNASTACMNSLEVPPVLGTTTCIPPLPVVSSSVKKCQGGALRGGESGGEGGEGRAGGGGGGGG